MLCTFQGTQRVLSIRFGGANTAQKLNLRNSKGKKKPPWITVLFILDISVCVCVCVCVFFFFFFFSFSNLPEIFGGCVVHILLPRYCDNCLQRYPENFVIKTKRSLKSCNRKYGYSMPCKFRPAPFNLEQLPISNETKNHLKRSRRSRH